MLVLVILENGSCFCIPVYMYNFYNLSKWCCQHMCSVYVECIYWQNYKLLKILRKNIFHIIQWKYKGRALNMVMVCFARFLAEQTIHSAIQLRPSSLLRFWVCVSLYRMTTLEPYRSNFRCVLQKLGYQN